VGTGEHAMFFAARGHAVTGFDFVEEPIAAARRKAAQRSLIAKFLVKDALKLYEWTERFDNVLDSGLFHVFSDADRIRYVRGLETVLDPGGSLFLLCFSDACPYRKCHPGANAFEISDFQEDETAACLARRSECNNVALR